MRGGYEAAFAHVIDVEGGFQKDPADRGNWTPDGRLVGTRYGISARAYPYLDIEALTLEDARAIYKRDYWDKVAGDALPAGVDLFVFDWAVNSGPGAAARALQAELGVVQDGAIGPVTLAALEDSGRSAQVWVGALRDRREDFYRSLDQFERYGRGWLARNQKIAEAALAAAGAADATEAAPRPRRPPLKVRPAAAKKETKPMLPLLAALAPTALQLLKPAAVKLAAEFVPDLVESVAGDKTGKIVGGVIDVAARAAGVEIPADDAEAAKAAAEDAIAVARARPEIAGDLAAMMRSRVELARVELEHERVAAEDRASARARQVAIVEGGGRDYMGWAVLAAGLLMMAGGGLAILYAPGLEEGVRMVLAGVVTGGLGILNSVANFVFGSSRGSKAKDAALTGQKPGPLG